MISKSRFLVVPFLALLLAISASCSMQGDEMADDHIVGGEATFRRQAFGYVMEIDKKSETFTMKTVRDDDESTTLSDKVEVDYSRAPVDSEEIRAMSPGTAVWIVFFGTGDSVSAAKLELVV